MRVSSFAMVGLAAGQTARLNVVFAAPPDPDLPAVQCVAELSFLDADGAVVTGPDGRTYSLTTEVPRGGSAFLDLDSRGLVDPGDRPAPETGALVDPGDRVSIRASLRVTGRCARHVDNPDILPSLELFDTATGRTTTFVTPGSTRFIKEVDPGPSR